MAWKAVKTSAGKPNYRLEDLDRRVVQSGNAFGLTLFQKLSREDDGHNVVISPLSISMALNMAYNGSDKETREQMGAALQLKGISMEEVNLGNRMLRDLLTHSDQGLKLSIANSLWLKKGWSFQPDFLRKMETA